MAELVLKEEANRVVGACMEVFNSMGSGFLESVYHECLATEFQKREIPFVSEAPLALSYKGQTLRTAYRADFIVFGAILIELKAVSEISDAHRSQLLNYLAATGLKLGLLINFGGSSLQHERLANTRSEKFVKIRVN